MLVADDRVLISRWVDGVPLSRVMADGARPDRDRAGELLLRLFASSLVHVRRLHGDPHPGNLRLMADGRLAVLDFGATENTPQGWPARLGPLLAAGRDGDAAELQRITAEAGPLQPASVSSDAFMSLFDPDLDPLRTPAYRCTRGWLQEQTRRASDPLSAASCTQRRLLHPAPTPAPSAG